MESLWLRAVDCPLLQPASSSGEAQSLRLVQRFLEIGLVRQASEELAAALLEEVVASLRADSAAIWEAAPSWHAVWQFARRGVRASAQPAPHLLADVLDREAGVSQPPAGQQPATLATCLSFTDRPNRVLVIQRPRDPFDRTELEYAVAAGHFFGVALEKCRAWDQFKAKLQRLEALAEINRQLAQEKETVPLLEHIAEQAARLLGTERASIFLWDRGRKELVGRPALGLPNGELRLPENTGVVGKVVQSGRVEIVDDVRHDADWHGDLDSTGFKTRNLLCVPLNGPSGERQGALEVINKKGPYSPEDVITLEMLAQQVAIALGNVREHEALVRSHNELEGQARLASRIVGSSTAVVALRGTIERVSRTELPVLILGESGTGKEVVARALHYASPRASNPFIPVNCAAIAETLLESELFGHEKGAFTGADATRAGKFESASGGTLFLDEIGDLSAGGQAKLLRVLEEKAVYRVGSSTPIPVDTRIVAATNRNLAEAVRSGKFREDLFYRLTVVTLDLPPLRDRRDDILVLADHFLANFSREAGRKPLKFSAEARQRLEQHNWPGNVRELRNLIERVAYLCTGDKVEPADLPFIVRPTAAKADPYAELPLSEATDAFQRDHIQRTIERAGSNVTEAAKLLGLHRPNLYRKMKMLGMNT